MKYAFGAWKIGGDEMWENSYLPTRRIAVRALVRNFKTAARLARGASVIAVVKADAYGHGARACVPLLYAAGARLFAVANAYEALELLPFFEQKSKECFTENMFLYILGPTDTKSILPLFRPFVCFSVHSLSYARALSRAVEIAVARGDVPASFRLAVAMKAETGMHRLGFEDCGAILKACRLPFLHPVSLYSHFSQADTAPNACTARQMLAFRAVRARLMQNGLSLFTHIGAGAALCRFGACAEDAVRVGLPLYGVAPFGRTSEFLPVMRVCATVLCIKRLKQGDVIGYGDVRAQHPMRIACLGIGYADGLPVSASGARVCLGGRLCPIVGALCMDRTFLEIGELALREGMQVCLFGEDAQDTLRFASECGVSPYVLLSVCSRRTQKVYMTGEKTKSLLTESEKNSIIEK